MTGMNSVNENLAILIANVSNRDELDENIDENYFHTKIQSCHKLIVEILDNYEGILVKSTNDQIVCAFSSANYAANAAITLNKLFNSDLIEKGVFPDTDASMSVHVGIHYGQTIMLDGKDVYGNAVDIASELVILAEKEYIFTTGSTVLLLSPELQESAYFVKSTMLKCDQENIELFELNWKQFQ